MKDAPFFPKYDVLAGNRAQIVWPFCRAFLPPRHSYAAMEPSMRIPSRSRYHRASALGSFALKKMPPIPVTRGRRGRAAMVGSRAPSISPFRKAFPRYGFQEAPPMKLSRRSVALLVVIVHHAVAGLHSVAHGVLGIALTPFQGAFVAGAIIAAPAVAVVLLVTRHAGWGALLLVVSMLASLVFGIVYHVLLPGSDNKFDV